MPILPFCFQNNTCYIKEVPFRGVNCSDAAGTQLAFSDIVNTLHLYNATYQWDLNSLTPWYNYMVGMVVVIYVQT